ncbi:hypothetical protein DYY88_03240 [Leptolyngbya iicbica LK]|uniref:Uncharacterized protein n=1 Tax=Leptolyngbya iicbica LK TaxID=2294035 RepID=A0A4V2E3F7_9CYAN|nr:hypothetical protein [Leptolyngbya sp. LK]RZM82280.1 hypothetical protein DYY88_03240 [Leptolyngbya sp. LK]
MRSTNPFGQPQGPTGPVSDRAVTVSPKPTSDGSPGTSDRRQHRRFSSVVIANEAGLAATANRDNE